MQSAGVSYRKHRHAGYWAGAELLRAASMYSKHVNSCTRQWLLR